MSQQHRTLLGKMFTVFLRIVLCTEYKFFIDRKSAFFELKK